MKTRYEMNTSQMTLLHESISMYFILHSALLTNSHGQSPCFLSVHAGAYACTVHVIFNPTSNQQHITHQVYHNMYTLSCDHLLILCVVHVHTCTCTCT